MKPRVIAAALILAGVIHFNASVGDTRAPTSRDPATQAQMAAGPESAQTDPTRGRLPTAAPERLLPAFVASTPFAALEIASLPREVTSLPRVIASLPRSDPHDASSPPLPPPTRPRSGCDPAYPDQRTCIPPGPPFDQGCAITAERRFTVLPPDPQALDHDHDGIGCEPIRR